MTTDGLGAPHLREIEPDLVIEIHTLLLQEGYPALAAQVAELKIYDRCRCADGFCGTFYTSPRPWPTRGTDDFTIGLSSTLSADVIDAKIVAIEVLNREDTRSRIHAAVP